MPRDRYGRRLASDGLPLRGGVGPRNLAKLGFGAVVLIVALSFVIPAAGGYYKQRTVTATVTDKERVCDSATSDGSGGFDQDCYYLIFTDNGTFKVTDSLIIGRFDSSDVYGRFRRDRTYRFKVYGWRFGCTSSYPNVATNPVEVGR